MPRIAIIVDHPQRDLAGLVLTAFRLCQEGVTCHLVPLNLQARELWALAPDFVLLNFARRGTEQLAAQLSETGIKFGVLDTEGGVWSSPEEYSNLLWADRPLLRKVELLCAWGPAIADHLIGEGFFDPSQVTLTGCPRFDLYHPLWREVLCKHSLHETGRRKRILINTNFSFSNPRFASVECHVEQVQQDFGWQLIRIMKVLKSGAAGMAAVVDLVQNLARHFPLSEIILRPHPFEQDEYYRTRLAHLENVTVDQDGPVQAQIHQADVIIQRSCSTAIEAGLASIPTLSPQWVPAEMQVPAAEDVSIPCASYDELRANVNEIFSGSYQPSVAIRRRIEQVVGAWFYRADGLAHQRVSDVVRACLNGVREVNERLCNKLIYDLGNGSRKNLSYLGTNVRCAFKLSPDWSFRQMRNVPLLSWTRTDKFFGVADVGRLIERVRAVSQAHGFAARPVHVEFARLRNDYLQKYHGHSVTLSC